MTNQSITPASSHASSALCVSTVAGLAWALAYLHWSIALPLWLVGSLGFLYYHRPFSVKEWVGFLVVCVGSPATAFVVYRCLTPVA